MSLDDAIRQRRSVRGFLPREAPQALLDEIFALAQWAPSNCNVQPWLPHVVSGPALRRLRDALVPLGDQRAAPEPDWPATWTYDGIYRERQIGAARALYGAMSIDRHDQAGRHRAYVRNHEFFDAPHAVFIFMQPPFDIREAGDAGMYAQTLMLALTSRGLASCAQGALSLYPAVVREHLGIDDDRRLLFGISFGYEDPTVAANAARVDRAPLDQAVRFHR
jgi:nitroreductase